MNINFMLLLTASIILMTPLIENLMMLGGMLLLSALCITLLISLLFNSWFAFILFLIYITGLLVLFSYMLAMSPNTHPSSFWKTTKLVSWTITMMITMFLLKFMVLPEASEATYEWKVVLMYIMMNLNIYLSMAVILLVTLVMVVSMCFKSPTPLRPFFKK